MSLPLRGGFAPPSAGRLWARFGLDPSLGAVEGVAIEWRAGVLTAVQLAPRPPRDYPPEVCFPDHLLTPGLLNAHTHLDYAFLAGHAPRAVGFTPWLRAILAARRTFQPADEPAAREACRRAVGETIMDGVTEVWDISSFGWARQEIKVSGLRAISFAEWLAPGRAAWPVRWEAWQKTFGTQLESENQSSMEAGGDPAGRLRLGLSCHAPYSVCPPALEAAAGWARRRRLPLGIHLAESPEENELLIQGRGPLLELLAELAPADPREELGTGRSPIARADAAGALSPATLAIHCNFPAPAEIPLLAERGAVVVFCPRSHVFFGYPPYPLEAYRRAGVRLALGTDSLASNDSHSLRAELRALAGLAADWSPQVLLACASGALLGPHPPYGRRGLLAENYPAQWSLWRLDRYPASPTPEALLDTLLSQPAIIRGLEALS